MVLNPDSLSAILSRYTIGKFRDIEVISHSNGESSYRIDLGAKHPTLLLKRYSDYDMAQLHLSNAMMLDIADQTDVPIASPLKTKNGKTVVHDDENAYSLFRVPEHIVNHYPERIDIPPERVVSAARTLASFHKAVSHILPHRTIKSKCFDFQQIGSLFSVHETIQQHYTHTRIDSFLLSSLPRLQDHFKDYLNRLKYVPKHSNLQLIHGRFTPQSLVFSGPEVSVLLDYEYIRFDHPCYEIAESLAHFSRSDITVTRFDISRLRSFLNAYVSIHAPPPVSQRDVIVFLKHSRLEFVAKAVKKWSFSLQDPSVVDVVSESLKDLDAIDAQEHDIITSFSNAGLLK
ncbi:MAG: phosphotransferase [Nanoarchaeota archaeon]